MRETLIFILNELLRRIRHVDEKALVYIPVKFD